MGLESQLQGADFFSRLPNEIILDGIFSFLPVKSVIALSCVDRRLNALSKDPKIWQSFFCALKIQRPLVGLRANWYRIGVERGKKLSDHFKDRPLDGYRQPVFSLAKYYDQLVTGSKKTIRIWDTQTHKTTCMLKGHKNKVVSLDVFSGLVISGSADNTVRVWNPRAEKKKDRSVAKFKAGEQLTSLQVKDKKIYAAVQGCIKVWDLESLACISTFLDVREPVFQVDTQENYLARASKNKTVVIWDIRQPQNQCFNFQDTGDWPNYALSVKLIGNQLFSGLVRGSLEVRDLRIPDIAQIKNPNPLDRQKTLDPLGSLVVIKTDNFFLYTQESLKGRVSLWNHYTGEPIKQLSPYIEEEPKKNPSKVKGALCLEVDSEKMYVALKTGGVTIREFGAVSEKKMD